MAYSTAVAPRLLSGMSYFTLMVELAANVPIARLR
jgi:hypothetical protein